jgi:hypothetical protein
MVTLKVKPVQVLATALTSIEIKTAVPPAVVAVVVVVPAEPLGDGFNAGRRNRSRLLGRRPVRLAGSEARRVVGWPVSDLARAVV